MWLTIQAAEQIVHSVINILLLNYYVKRTAGENSILAKFGNWIEPSPTVPNRSPGFFVVVHPEINDNLWASGMLFISCV